MVNSSIVAHGLRWHDKDGAERWMTGDTLLAHIRDMIDARAKRQRQGMEKLAYHVGQKHGELRSQIAQARADVERLRTELAEVRKALPPRLVKMKDDAA
jgi:hypothetical protein